MTKPGPKPIDISGHKMTLERKRVNENYHPDNCIWATRVEQANNTRATRFLEHDGKRQSVSAWARELGVGKQRILSRLNMGWTTQQALEMPKGARI